MTAAEHRSGVDAWDDHARWWRETFTQGADPEYEEQILPLAHGLAEGDRVLEVGAGEGQVSRAMRGPGRVVVGVDPSAVQIAEAGARGGLVCARAGAEALPFADGSFTTVVFCLVLEHVDDLDGALDEAVRVVAPGGRVVLFLNHPLLQTPGSGWIDDHVLDPPEQYWRVGPYLVEQATFEQVSVEREVRFVHRPLGRYVNGLAERGVLVERLLEPAPPPGFLARAPEYEAAATIPRLLVLVGRAHGSGR